MSEYYVYRSKFAPYIQGLIKEKTQKGKLKSTMFKSYMLEFDRFFQNYNVKENFITEDTIIKWRATRVNDNERNIYHKYIAWIHLCKYMCSLGIECYIPKTPKSGRQNDYIPYIYTHEEVRIIFSISDNLRILKGMDRTPMFILPALCRLLYSSGIRIGEALSIKNEDVDYENRIIHIRKSKNDKERLAVINDSLLSVLEQYRDYRNKIPFTHVSSPSSHFFLTQLGKPCLYGNILTWFHKILYFGEIPKQAYFNRPRIHDIRHTTAVHTLEKLVKDGMDIYCALPLISAFLGHKCIRSTETYVKLTHEMFPDIIEAEALTSYIFPSQPSKTNDNYDGFC